MAAMETMASAMVATSAAMKTKLVALKRKTW